MGPISVTGSQEPVIQEPVITVLGDGRVLLSHSIDLSQLYTLKLSYLLAVREMVNTVIYDLERNKK